MPLGSVASSLTAEAPLTVSVAPFMQCQKPALSASRPVGGAPAGRTWRPGCGGVTPCSTCTGHWRPTVPEWA